MEKSHEGRYRKLAQNIAEGGVFTRPTPMRRHCTNCGCIHEGTEAPKECPACKNPQSYYEVLAENY